MLNKIRIQFKKQYKMNKNTSQYNLSKDYCKDLYNISIFINKLLIVPHI